MERLIYWILICGRMNMLNKKVFVFIFFLIIFLTVGKVEAVSNGCSALAKYNGVLKDSSTVIQSCIDKTPKNGVVALPVGKYYIAKRIKILKSMTLTTEGKSVAMPRCSNSINDCAEIIAMPDFADKIAMINIRHDAYGTTIDHLVINGNKENRYDHKNLEMECNNTTVGSQESHEGKNIVALYVNNFVFTNNIDKNAACSSSLVVGGILEKNLNYVNGTSYITIKNNLIIGNGFRRLPFFSDGITIHKSNNVIVEKNEFVNNTDVHLILGGCTNCQIKNNVFLHTDNYDGSSSVVIQIAAWMASSPGVYDGTEVAFNNIDCGVKKRCMFGIVLGAHSWFSTMSGGGIYHDNVIANAQYGFAIEDFTDAEIYNNLVTGEVTKKFTIGNDSKNIDTSKDKTGVIFEKIDLDEYGTFPSSRMCKNDCDIPSNNSSFVRQVVPNSMVAGKNYNVSITFKNNGINEWNKSNLYSLKLKPLNSNDVWGVNNVNLFPKENIDAIDGSSKTFVFNVKAPLTPRKYNFSWQMNQEKSGFFGDVSPNIFINVSGLSKKTGDFNGDGLIDVNDYSLWYKEFHDGKMGSVVKNGWQSDVTGTDKVSDNRVDILDYSVWYRAFYH